jgi:hypothetical protein
MKIDRVKIKNFRGFRDVELELAGESRFLIAPNAGGKTSLLTAIARALGRDLAFTAADFADRTEEILIQVTVSDLDAGQRSALGNYVDFTPGRPPTVTLQVRSTWNDSSEAADTEHGYTRPGSRSRRDERDAISLQWLPTFREPARMLSFGNERNLLGLLLENSPVGSALEAAIDRIEEASALLTSDSAFRAFLDLTRGELASFIPNVADDAYTISTSAIGRNDLLSQFELFIAYLSEAVSIARQSSGLGQLSVFSLLSVLIQQHPGTVLLVDEPEISLHPQAQRALIRKLVSLDCQVLVATHSANMLDRIDPRQIVRLEREQGQLTFVSPTSVSDEDARYLSRFTTPFVAEAFFSQEVVLVEGVSDQLAVEAVAERLGRDFDADGLSIVPMQGAGNIKAFSKLFGPMGLDLKMAGLCDLAEAPLFANSLAASGVPGVLLPEDLSSADFFVCSRDLEDELIRALGDARTEAVIEEHGDLAAFRTFQQQASQRAETLTVQLHRFISGRKVEYAVPMLDALDTDEIPEPLLSLVRSLT